MAIEFVYNGMHFRVEDGEGCASLVNLSTGVFAHSASYKNLGEALPNRPTLEIPESVTFNGNIYPVIKIGKSVFDNLTSVVEIIIPASIQAIAWSFWRCNKLQLITINSDNQKFCSVDGVLYSKDMRILFAYPKGKRDICYTVDSRTTEIANLAFKNCDSLECIIFPKRLKKIGVNAFYRCAKLRCLKGLTKSLKVFRGNIGSDGNINPVCDVDGKRMTMKDLVAMLKVHSGQNNTSS